MLQLLRRFTFLSTFRLSNRNFAKITPHTLGDSFGEIVEKK